MSLCKAQGRTRLPQNGGLRKNMFEDTMSGLNMFNYLQKRSF